jgi:hypothetical protein
MTQKIDDEERIGAASSRSRDAEPKTFAELAVAESVSPTDFLTTYHNYTTGGWAIDAETTVGVFNRVIDQLSAD